MTVINILRPFCLSLPLWENNPLFRQTEAALHTYMTFTTLTVLFKGFVTGWNNNNLWSITRYICSALSAKRLDVVFGSFVWGVWDALVCGCLWETCHCLVLRDYDHGGTHFDSCAASYTAEPQYDVSTQIHPASAFWFILSPDIYIKDEWGTFLVTNLVVD